MSDLRKHLERQLKAPEFAAEWERQRPEREYIKTIIAARTEHNMTQKELQQKCGFKVAATTNESSTQA